MIRSLFFNLLALLLPSVLLADTAEESWYCGKGSGDVDITWIDTDLGKQKAVIVGHAEDGELDTLVIFLHGDSPFRDPVYQYELARKISAERKDAVVAAILRPGYKDGCGDESGGEAGQKMGDNYTLEVVDSLADTILELKASSGLEKTILIGHSGGAALGALLASRHSQIQDQVILVACPCDLPAWRESMMLLTGNAGWRDAMPGLSAIDEIEKLDRSKRVALIVGEKDEVTPPNLSVSYLEALLAADVAADLTIIYGGDHDMILRDDILKIALSKIGN